MSSKPKVFSKKTAYSRECHDCGKPTNDYRCAACWRKRGRSESDFEQGESEWSVYYSGRRINTRNF